MAVNALGFLDSICITVFMSPCDIVGISGRLADHDSLSTQRFFRGKQLSRVVDPRSGSCDHSDPDVAIKAYVICFQRRHVRHNANYVPDRRAFARKERNLHCDL